ncbi:MULTISPECIES: helix-turn-helix domain-containing protein [unclassified Moraxella]|uniref:helix-turn-helix domain-containing protein n=1 Tax=unclassified Moraxella TaxID=2685852 RepID=UPI00359D9E42
MTTQSQCDTLLTHLRMASITHKEAVQKYFIMGFLARISELRQMGYDIKDRYETSPTGARYKVYYLEGESSDARI